MNFDGIKFIFNSLFTQLKSVTPYLVDINFWGSALQYIITIFGILNLLKFIFFLRNRTEFTNLNLKKVFIGDSEDYSKYTSENNVKHTISLNDEEASINQEERIGLAFIFTPENQYLRSIKFYSLLPEKTLGSKIYNFFIYVPNLIIDTLNFSLKKFKVRFRINNFRQSYRQKQKKLDIKLYDNKISPEESIMVFPRISSIPSHKMTFSINHNKGSHIFYQDLRYGKKNYSVLPVKTSIINFFLTL
ncbi:hypothetical protein OL233_08115 [Vagococcus sp. PNs007]|uniref:Uncharacterized protein n=1 Tax=Vagococcus proximus TaxID=2991417 RepID=A0ABT5X2L3_9ENTE|nr:hypothetical protein [Vagococcus proximus]MDF0480246.1 hypothetical protein [Vagococcus proximus]